MAFNKKWENELKIENDKIPWYLNGFFIIAVFFASYAFFFIPAIILWGIRMAKYKGKRKITVVVTSLFVTVPLVVGTVGNIKEKNTINKIMVFIENGNYNEAENLLQAQKSILRKTTYYELYAKMYEEEGRYDAAAESLLEYCREEKDVLKISSDILDQLTELQNNVSTDKKDEIEKLFVSIDAANMVTEEKKDIDKQIETDKEEFAGDNTSFIEIVLYANDNDVSTPPPPMNELTWKEYREYVRELVQKSREIVKEQEEYKKRSGKEEVTQTEWWEENHCYMWKDLKSREEIDAKIQWILEENRGYIYFTVYDKDDRFNTTIHEFRIDGEWNYFSAPTGEWKFSVEMRNGTEFLVVYTDITESVDPIVLKECDSTDWDVG